LTQKSHISLEIYKLTVYKWSSLCLKRLFYKNKLDLKLLSNKLEETWKKNVERAFNKKMIKKI